MNFHPAPPSVYKSAPSNIKQSHLAVKVRMIGIFKLNQGVTLDFFTEMYPTSIQAEGVKRL
jgi:hypothetical protein